MKSYLFLLPLLSLFLISCQSGSETAQVDAPYKALIIDGQNNHTVWPKSTFMMKAYLEETGLFSVDIARTVFTWRGAKWLPHYPLEDGIERQDLEEPIPDPGFTPNFSDYDVVISNFGWKAADWPEDTQRALEDYMSAGGGFITVHAANNSFPEWLEYNKMIGLGGWGGRNEKDGPYVYFNDEGEEIRDMTPGPGGGHGPQHEFQIQIRDKDHPITRGMPEFWMHTQDECYDKLRGPAENMTIIATAYSSPEFKGTDRHEPALMVLNYGEGRIFHTILGHEDYSFEGVGFIVTLQRGAEWAATGEVTQELPDDFPTADNPTHRPFDG